jgi:hypothetical protein
LLAKSELSDHALKTLRVERAIHSLEIGVAEDQAHRFLGRLRKSEPPCLFVKCCFRKRLLENLPIESEGTGLIHGQRPAELAAYLLQPFVVDLPELLGRDLGAADLGQR